MYFDDKGKGRLKVESKCNHLLLGCIDQKKKTTFGFIDIFTVIQNLTLQIIETHHCKNVLPSKGFLGYFI